MYSLNNCDIWHMFLENIYFDPVEARRLDADAGQTEIFYLITLWTPKIHVVWDLEKKIPLLRKYMYTRDARPTPPKAGLALPRHAL